MKKVNKNVIKVLLITALLLLVLPQPMYALTVGIPTEALSGLPSPELTALGHTLLILYGGYSNVQPSIVEGTLSELWEKLNSGSIDAILPAPNFSSTSSYNFGTIIGNAKAEVAKEGHFICISDTDENKKFFGQYGFLVSNTSKCKESTTINIPLSAVYGNSAEGLLFSKHFEQFIKNDYSAISLAVKAEGFDATKATLWQTVSENKESFIFIATLAFLLLILLYVYVSERKKSRTNKNRSTDVERELNKRVEELTRVSHQLDMANDENKNLRQQRERLELAKTTLERHMQMLIKLFEFMEMQRTIENTDFSDFLNSLCANLKDLFQAEEVGVYVLKSRSHTYNLAAGSVTTLPEQLDASDALLYEVLHKSPVDEKIIENKRTLFGALDPLENVRGLLVVVNPNAPNISRIVSAVSGMLHLLMSYGRNRMELENIYKYIDLLETISHGKSFEEMVTILSSYGFNIMEQSSNVRDYKGHMIMLSGSKNIIIAPEDWPTSLDTLLIRFVENVSY
ncbi:hypothetical protein [Coprothermobacter platensis]|uniref:hypothetical protein n=1 Tax=Coprothermobacter platensis TaxID=108819 RepID=UPI00037E8767|nr:hypothetical protein [Coprothermobacter platensis]